MLTTTRTEKARKPQRGRQVDVVLTGPMSPITDTIVHEFRLLGLELPPAGVFPTALSLEFYSGNDGQRPQYLTARGDPLFVRPSREAALCS